MWPFFTFHVETCHGLEASPKLFHTNEFNGAQRNFWEMASIVFLLPVIKWRGSNFKCMCNVDEFPLMIGVIFHDPC